jgi:enediyne biosynthesis protein E4
MNLKNNLFLIVGVFSFYFSSAQYFTKVENSPLSSTPGDSRSVNWVDVNNDGFIDCFISNGPRGGQNNSLFINNGKGNFAALENDSIVLDHNPSDGATFADVDNDGDLDAFVVNWYNVNNLFYLNDGKGRFQKITAGDFVNDRGYSETAAFGDYDNDGFVDLYITNSEGRKNNFFYQNRKNAAFYKLSDAVPALDTNYSRSANWCDIDNDGDLDLFVTNENKQSENLYRNDGKGNFTKLTEGALLTDGGNTTSASWADIDNDGDLDVFLTNDGGYNSLFKNEGNFRFSKMKNDTTSKTPAHSFSSAWSDIDNDGDVDLFVTNAFSGKSRLVNYFYVNDGHGNFSRDKGDIIVTDSAWSYGCAFGDYDNDGFQDLAVATCRVGKTDDMDLLYHNNGNKNNWITIKLEGTKSNRSAIGAKVYVKATIKGKSIWQMREVSAQNGYCSQNDLRVHFGLEQTKIIEVIKVVWPSGITQTLLNHQVNEFMELVEATTK